MNTRPTREQIDAARDVLLPLPPSGATAELNREGVDALRVLLAATESPTNAPAFDVALVDAADRYLSSGRGDHESARLVAHLTAALRERLAPPAPPTDEQLAEEAARFACAATKQACSPRDTQDVLDEVNDPSLNRTPWGHIAVVYFSNARREGRR